MLEDILSILGKNTPTSSDGWSRSLCLQLFSMKAKGKIMKKLEEIFDKLKVDTPARVAVAAAADADVLQAISSAYELGIAEPILVGNEEEIMSIATEKGMDLSSFEIIDKKTEKEAATEAVRLVSDKEADILMKGFLPTGVFLKALLNPDADIRTQGSLMSIIAIFESKDLGRLLFLTDPGFIPAPTFEDKIKMIESVVKVARKFGVEKPNVAVLCASETYSEKIPSTVDAKKLEDLNIAGEIKDCIVAGPISLDLAISEESAKHKGYNHPVAGKADILIAPDIEAANILLKSMTYFGGMQLGGVMMGADIPIIFTSRTDSANTKLNTIACNAIMVKEI